MIWILGFEFRLQHIAGAFSPDTPPACQSLVMEKQSPPPPPKGLVAAIESIFSCISTTPALLTMSA